MYFLDHELLLRACLPNLALRKDPWEDSLLAVSCSASARQILLHLHMGLLGPLTQCKGARALASFSPSEAHKLEAKY